MVWIDKRNLKRGVNTILYKVKDPITYVYIDLKLCVPCLPFISNIISRATCYRE